MNILSDMFYTITSVLLLKKTCILQTELVFSLTNSSFFVRLKRDISERGRDLQGVLKQYDKFVKPVS